MVFEEWIREVDRRITKEARKIVLLVDNSPALPSIDNLAFKMTTEIICLQDELPIVLKSFCQDLTSMLLKKQKFIRANSPNFVTKN